VSGYVRIHRSLIGHPAFRNDAEAMAFAWLVAKAAWKQSRVRYKERAIILARGQLAISVRDFANAMDRDKAWIERLLKRLRAETMIETVCETGVNVITICNYSEYQTDQVLCETPRETPNKTEARQAQDTEQEREEVNKQNSEPKGSSQKFVLPSDIPAEQWGAWLEARKKIRKSPTDHAKSLAVAELRRLRDEEGWPPGDVLNHCTMNSYQGIFPPNRKSKNDRSDKAPVAEAFNRIFG
jgi:hypothetical protein